MVKEKGEINLKELFQAYLKKAWIIILAALLTGMALGLYSMFLKSDTYTSSTTLMVSKENTTVNDSDITLASKMVETYKVIIYSDSFLNSVIDDINEEAEIKAYDLDVKTIKDTFKVNQRGETEVFDVVVTTSDAKLSYAIADAIASHVKYELPHILPYPEGVIYTSIIDPAVVPLKANSKNTLRNSALGVLIGALIAMLIIFIVWYNDTIIRSRKDIEENLGIPVLGVIPRQYVKEN